MHAQSGAQEDRAAAVNPASVPWLVTAVEALEGYRLKVGFADGTEGMVEMKTLLHSPRAGVFAGLVDPAKFAQVYVENDAVTWPGELDLAPDAMYGAIREAGRWVLT